MYPFAYIGRTILQPDTLTLTSRQKPHSLTVYKPHFFEVQRDGASLGVLVHELLQPRHVSLFNSPAQG